MVEGSNVVYYWNLEYIQNSRPSTDQQSVHSLQFPLYAYTWNSIYTHGAVWNAIIVCIVITSVANSIPIRILLPRIGSSNAVVLPAVGTDATGPEIVVWIPVQINVRSTTFAIACPTDLTLERQVSRLQLMHLITAAGLSKLAHVIKWFYLYDLKPLLS